MTSRRWFLLAVVCLAGSACAATEGDAIVNDTGVLTDAGAPSDSGALSDTDCSQEALNGGDDEYVFTSAYVVNDGELGELCFGDDDDTILDAWDSLVTITPPGPAR